MTALARTFFVKRYHSVHYSWFRKYTNDVGRLIATCLGEGRNLNRSKLMGLEPTNTWRDEENNTPENT